MEFKKKLLLIFVLLLVCVTYIQFGSLNRLILKNNAYEYLRSIFQNGSANDSNEIVYFESECACKRDKILQMHKHADYTALHLMRNPNEASFLYAISNKELADSVLTCDLYNTLRRGKSQKVISYSLYNKNRFYYDKLKEIAKQMKQLYPEWIMRVYYDQTIDKSIICEVECEKDEKGALLDNADFCDITNVKLNVDYGQNASRFVLDASYMHAMIWRWLPMADSFVDVFMSRDTDSYLLQREVDSVNVWLNSDKVGHIMRGILIE